MKDELDNQIHMEAQELDLRSLVSDAVKPSTYSLELFTRSEPFTKEQKWFIGGKVTIRSCEFGYITTIFNEDDPRQAIVQAVHKSLIIQLIEHEYP